MQGPTVHLPLETTGTVYFVDEAGSKGSLGLHFVTAAAKTSDPDRLSRAILAVCNKHRYNIIDEFKFGRVTKKTLPLLCAIVDEAVELLDRVGVFVLDKRHFDPWMGSAQWEGHLFATERLLRGMVTRKEVATALLDHISVPAGVSYGDQLLSRLNPRLHSKRFTSAVSLDSKTCTGLQVADLFASATYYYRRKVESEGIEKYLQDQTPKARLSRHVASALGVGTLDDVSNGKVTVRTSHEKSLRQLAEERKGE